MTSVGTDSSFCEHRFLMQMYNIPLTRFTPENPYLSKQFSKEQLDMRRKAEILKYSSNKSSSQTNNLTKRQQFSALVKGSLPTPSQEILRSKTPICPADDMMLTPTSSCDVPGPITYLYNDERVPLYNYSSFNTRSYPDYVPNNDNPWQFVILPDILVPGKVYYLIIKNTVNDVRYNYNVTVPLSIFVLGKNPPINISRTITVKATNVTLSIYYGSHLVNSINANPIDVSNISLTFNVPSNTNSSPVEFSVSQFVGNLIFPNIMLYTTPTYVYTFVLNATLTTLPNNTGIIQSQTLIANMELNKNTISGCSLVGNYSAIDSGASISVSYT